MKTTNVLMGVIAFLLVAILGLQAYSMFGKNKTDDIKVATTTKNVPLSSPETTTLKESTSTTSDSLYKGITDDKFVTYATNVINARCPFYQPNGVAYRECLSDWLDSLRKKALVEENSEVNAYCETFSKKYADVISFEESELFTKCAIYMLR